METTDKGKLQFKFAKDGLFESELTQKWFPDQKFSFTPAQFHFHNKGTEKNSEHTIDGGGFDAEMHIVSMNEDPSTQDLFWQLSLEFFLKCLKTRLRAGPMFI